MAALRPVRLRVGPSPGAVAGHDAMAPLLPTFRCPACELAGAEVVRGDELEVDSIEVADGVADDATDDATDGARTPAANSS